ncbi:hypothetical protein Phum_PHUM069610 [Pediculus humanus corporis]|uniref:Uncharacterized protein n=1 Tax=Pediculus humanus subsp. corporis TaxID=121224 RepID=E0VBT4_PEDHC|nr:uncharacterized protein Phum_PHUM069610 [Pediculus humanus corporis]EEB10840.1 hypothetical protein Phum_PHUM069610 [Pediculus humanus corporis]
MHHPSWILPWGVPLQKMVAVPMHPAVSPHHPGLQLQHHPAAPAAVHVTAPVIGLPPPHLGAIRSFVAAQQSPQRSRKNPFGFE